MKMCTHENYQLTVRHHLIASLNTFIFEALLKCAVEWYSNHVSVIVTLDQEEVG